MKILYNNTYKNFLKEYSLQENFSFDVNIPKEVKVYLDSEILDTDLGVTLECINALRKNNAYNSETQSLMEDSENHFHVDWYLEPMVNKEVFMLGTKVIHLLAKKFQNEGYKGIRLWYYFQTPEQSIEQEKEMGIYEEGDTYYISDRLSFYRRREDDIITEQHNKMILDDNKYGGCLFIDL